MKTKCLFTLSALLLAPLLSQAEWIETSYWPYIYRYDGNTWEYAYTPGFWTCNYFTEEYTAWGTPGSSLAQGIHDIWEPGVFSNTPNGFFWPLLYFSDGESWISGDVFYGEGLWINLAEHLMADHPGPLLGGRTNSIINLWENPCGAWERITGPDTVRWFFNAHDRTPDDIRYFTVLMELQFIGPIEGNLDMYLMEDTTGEITRIEDVFEIRIPDEMPYPLNHWGP
jgi:hypothetical protein